MKSYLLLNISLQAEITLIFAAHTYTNMFIKLFLLSVVILGVAFAGFAIKMFLIKGGQFKKQCSSSITNPKTGKKLACSHDSGGSGDSCHTSSLIEEIEYQKNSPISRRSIRIMTKEAISE